MKTPCLDCGMIVAGRASRCASCHKNRRGTRWSRLRLLALTRDRHRCRRCGAPCPHAQPGSRDRRHHPVDHIVAVAAGGLDVLDNLETLCFTDHGRKSVRENFGSKAR